MEGDRLSVRETSPKVSSKKAIGTGSYVASSCIQASVKVGQNEKSGVGEEANTIGGADRTNCWLVEKPKPSLYCLMKVAFRWKGTD
jgi:hypothetical protein